MGLPLPTTRIVTTPVGSGQGTQAPDAGVLINQYFNIVDEHDSQITGLQSSTSGLAPGGLSATQLDNQGLAAVGTSPASALSTDQGLQAFNALAAVNANVPYTLVSGAVDMVLQPDGTVGANGALTLDTTNPLTETYDGCYMYFAAGKAFAGSYPNWYYTVMTSTSAGTVYNNPYRGGLPMRPTTLVPIVDAGPGAYTQVTGSAILMLMVNVLGGAPGLMGTCEFKHAWSNSNTTNTKQLSPIYGSTNIMGPGNESATNVTLYRSTVAVVRNRGVANSQRALNSSGSVPFRIATNTAKNFTVGYQAQLSNSKDWIVLHWYEITMFPVGILEAPAPQVLTPTSALLVPPEALYLGLTSANLKNYLEPAAEDVSGFAAGAFNNNTGSMANAGLYYKAQPPFTTACVSNVAMFGRAKALAFKYDAQNTVMSLCFGQNQNSVANLFGYLDNNKKWAISVAVALSSNDPDHWPAVWGMPQKQKNSNTSNYTERDFDEAGLVNRGGRTFNGSLESSLAWTWNGSSFTNATSNNSQSGSDWGADLDRTQVYTIGYAWDPSTHLSTYFLNGVAQWQKDETSYASYSANDLYYLILSVQSRGLHIPYTMYVKSISTYQGA